MASSSAQLDQPHLCFQSWIAQQQADLEELLQALTIYKGDDTHLNLIVEKNIQHFQEYTEKRSILARENATSFFAPSWCTSLENSFLWIAGCRPSLAIRLVYSLCGSELEAQLNEFLQGVRKGNLGELSARQLSLVNDLQCRTIREEEKLSTQMASLQEDIADQPLLTKANEYGLIGASIEHVDTTLDEHALALAGILEEADKLRLSTLKELINILTPLQAADLLVAAKKLHLSIHEWGKRRDRHHGRP
nr:TPA_asm: hypothetical protein HUJ06_022695 [Nelumbo nucifera]